ncbi:His Kinase A (phospho-acceptor) domain-containing protein [Reichenbachiella agariperforans]|uniref:histidine kinase n=1 Tax=Reichenbachiella agariperforans TaxID=156994 RepID=A0A1M6KKD1_REIAG|nr:His Kinase A (phospho-acceptor) domain-containing protein [Reichenbachiella agariperforans]
MLLVALFVYSDTIGQTISREEINSLKDQAASSNVYLVFAIVCFALLIVGAFVAFSKLKTLQSLESEKKKLQSQYGQQISELNEDLKDCRVQSQSLYQKLNLLNNKSKEMKKVFKEAYDKVVAQNGELKGRLGEKQKTSSQTELEQIYDKLEDAQAMVLHSEKMASLGQLTAGIAHEINNPVNFVSNGVNSIKENFEKYQLFIQNYRTVCEQPTIEDVKKLYKSIRDDDKEYEELRTLTEESIDDVSYGTNRITEIVNGLRIFSRQDEHEVKEAEVGTIIDNALLILKPKYKKKAKILKDFDHGLKAIKCLPGQLNQALVNLIGNAADAIDFKGTITIRTIDKDADTVQIQVQDDGKGIPEDVRKKIFDPFYTTKPVGKGTGLGLSITYSIIDKHGGTISVDSTEGKGTVFTVNLPKKIQLKKERGTNQFI